MPKWIIVLAALLATIGGFLFVKWRISPKHEIERSGAAKSWHMHTIRINASIPPETVDVDVVCPSFQHRIAQQTRSDGTLASYEYISLNRKVYNRVSDQWVLSNTPAPDIWDCDRHGSLLDGDGISLPYSAILDSGTIRRGEVRVDGEESCRDYEIVVPTPTNILEREYDFFLCINERDYLPRQTRRTVCGSDHEDVILYSRWNEMNEPALPADFPR
jgi:hypothetical protein